MARGVKAQVRETKVVNLYLENPGLSYSEIAKRAGIPPKAGVEQVYEILNRPHVREQVENRRKQVANRVDRTREDLMRAMWEVVDQRGKDRVAAAALLSKMSGWDAPQKIEHSIRPMMVLPAEPLELE